MSNQVLAAKDVDKAFQQIEFTRSISATGVIRLIAAGQWGGGDGLVRGQAQAQAMLAFNFSFSENFMAGPIPILIQFSLLANATLGLGPAFATSSVLDWSKYDWDYSNTGLNLTINIAPSLSIGVGVRGLASASVKGIFVLTFFTGVCPVPAEYVGKLNNIRVKVAIATNVSIVLQFLFFTNSYTLWKYELPIYDSWELKDELENGGPESLLADRFDGMDLRQFLEEAVIVSSQSLAEVAEFSTEGATLANAEAAGVPYEDIEYGMTLEAEDGTRIYPRIGPISCAQGHGGAKRFQRGLFRRACEGDRRHG